MIDVLTKEAIALLTDLISIESFSRNENKTGDRIENWFKNKRHRPPTSSREKRTSDRGNAGTPRAPHTSLPRG